jgi:hypothetical protein
MAGFQVTTEALLSYPYDDSLRFLIGGDHLAFLFSQGNNFWNFNLLGWFFWHSDSVG